MPEIKNYTFSHTELAEVLIKQLDIHEGLWGIYLEFSLVAANAPTPPEGKNILPAAINFVNKIGIQRFPEPTNLSVDAALVNPVVKTKKTRSSDTSARRRFKAKEQSE